MALKELLVLFLAFSLHQAAAATCGQRYYYGDSRIVSGGYAVRGEWPWQIELQLYGSHTCGGTIVNSKWIVTAAHCMTAATSSYKVVAGHRTTYGSESSRKEFSLERYVRHPSYDSRTLYHDIALIKVRGTIPFSNYIQPACLATDANQFKYSYFSNPECWTSGWGRTSTSSSTSTTLKHLKQPLVSDSNCNIYEYYYSKYTLCTGRRGGSGICSGDSGGPLVCRKSSSEPWYLVGVTSFTAQTCATTYDGFSRVGYYAGWIKQIMASY